MIEVLWHGRGGQGAFTAARLLGAAASRAEGVFALAFPSFGPERRGAPMRAFTKIARESLGDRSAIERADVAVYLDDTLLSDAWDAELKPGGRVVVNSTRVFGDSRIVAVDANGLSEAALGRPLPNTTLLGALCALEGIGDAVSVDAVKAAIREALPSKLHEKNERLVDEGHEIVSRETSMRALNPDTRVEFRDTRQDVSRETSSGDPARAWMRPAGTLIPTLRSGKGPELDPCSYAHTTCFEAGYLVAKNAGWRNERPVVDAAACTGCLQCYLYCPDGAVFRSAALSSERVGASGTGADVGAGALPPVAVDYDFCKGCGICAKACRFGAISMVPEGGSR